MSKGDRKAPILVTGSPRSGTTWTGRMLAAAPGTAYLHEPFHYNNALLNERPARLFQYVSPAESERYTKLVGDLLQWKFPWRRRMQNVRTPRNIVGLLKGNWRFMQLRSTNARPIFKDPIALFSSEWLAKTFDMDVLMMIRHPAAFCSSVKLRDWRTDFDNFLSQSALMDRYLGQYESEMRRQTTTKTSIISNAILLWNCTHHVIKIFRDENPDWLFIRHEDLSRDPIEQFRMIYRTFGLEFSNEAEHAILDSSGEHNPVEQVESAPRMRNSKENINNWKKRLSADEIAEVREQTSEIWPVFYSESEW